MNLLLFVTLVIPPACLARSIIDDRILGGYDAKTGQFPHQISMQNRRGQHFCGGSIISNRVILTAAHCVYGKKAEQVFIEAGVTNLKRRGLRVRVQKLLHHENYNSDNVKDDVGLVFLAEHLPLGGNIHPIKLRREPVRGGENVRLSGWGLTSYPSDDIPNQLQWIRLRTLSNYDCKEALEGYPVHSTNVCAYVSYDRGACSGDSGGALIDGEDRQVGIVSWGIPCGEGKPDVYTSVAAYRNWIYDNMRCF